VKKALLRNSSGSVMILSSLAPLIFIACFFVQQSTIERHMMNDLEKKNLQTIVLSDNQFSWMNERKEIFFHDHLFDIKNYWLENGRFHFVGLTDEKESELVRQLQKQCGHSGDEILGQLFQLLLSIFNNTAHTEIIHTPGQTQIVLAPIDKLPDWYKLIPTPPPLC